MMKIMKDRCDRVENEVVKDKKNILLVGIIFILVAVILMLTAYIVYDKIPGISNNTQNNTLLDNEINKKIEYTKNVEFLDKDSRFVQILYETLSCEEDMTFPNEEYDSYISVSLDQLTDKKIYSLVMNRVTPNVVFEDTIGNKTIEYKERELRDIIQYIFGDSKAASFDFSNISSMNNNYFEYSYDKDRGVIIEKIKPINGTTVGWTFDTKLLQATKDKETGDVYLYEDVVGRLGGDEATALYLTKLTFGEENGVYYFRGVEIEVKWNAYQ